MTDTELVDALLRTDELGDRLAANMNSFEYYRKLEHSGLASQLRPYISNKDGAPAQRGLAIEIAHSCRVEELLPDLSKLALDANEILALRTDAAFAVSQYGDASARARLRPLALGEAGEDPDDELRGYGLDCAWPGSLSPEELFASLKKPENPNYVGGYDLFLGQRLPSTLRPVDLPAALAWLNGHAPGHSLPLSFRTLADRIMWLAWSAFDIPGVFEQYTIAVHRRLEAHEDIVDREHRADLQRELVANVNKRRQLASALLRRIGAEENPRPFYLFWKTQILKPSDDFEWALDLYHSETNDAALRAVLLEVLRSTMDVSNRTQVDTMFEASQKDSQLRDAFVWLLGPIPLNSPAASSLKANWEREQKAATTNDEEEPGQRGPTVDELLGWIDHFEAGETSAWWQLNIAMMFDSNGQAPDVGELGWDIMVLPGWAALDADAQARVVAAANLYLQRAGPDTNQWLGTNTLYRPALAGYRALMLLRSCAADVYAALPNEIWRKWMPIVLAFPTAVGVGDDKPHQLLVADAYAAAPDELTQTLGVLIDKENREGEHIFVQRKVRDCWDARIARVVLEKAKDPELKPNGMSDLLEELLKRGDADTTRYVMALLGETDPPDRVKVAVAASVLMQSGEPKRWDVVWSTMQRDKTLGMEIFERTMRGSGLGEYPALAGLRDEQLAGLYLWLLEQYPPEEDPVRSGGMAFRMDTRDAVPWWRSAVLDRLTSRGSRSAVEAVHSLSRARPSDHVLQHAYFLALETMRRTTWAAPSIEQLSRILADANRRYVTTIDQLADVVSESLLRLQTELKTSPSGAESLWDYQRATGTWVPKDEAAFSNHVTGFLRRDLSPERGIIVNREVQPRRGQFTDVYVDAVADASLGTENQFTYVIEAKGCWHPQLMTAMETQLVNKYLTDSRFRRGLYLVVWFNCSKWDTSDSRRTVANRRQKEVIQRELEAQAVRLRADRGVDVRVMIIDAALP